MRSYHRELSPAVLRERRGYQRKRREAAEGEWRDFPAWEGFVALSLVLKCKGPHARHGKKPLKGWPSWHSQRPQSYNQKERESANQLNEPGSRFFLEPPDNSPTDQHPDFRLMKPRAEKPGEPIPASVLQNHEIINWYCFRQLNVC